MYSTDLSLGTSSAAMDISHRYANYVEVSSVKDYNSELQIKTCSRLDQLCPPPKLDKISVKIESKETAAFKEKFSYKIHSLRLSPQWRAEGVIPPNTFAKEMCLSAVNSLFEKYLLIPDIIAPTKEAGVFLKYDKNDKSMIVEIYNTQEIAVVINDNLTKSILHVEDIVSTDSSDFSHAVEIFNS